MTHMRVGWKIDYKNAVVTWSATEEDELQAKRNHDQTLTRLNERGGLTWCEFLAILEHRAYRQTDLAFAQLQVFRVLAAR